MDSDDEDDSEEDDDECVLGFFNKYLWVHNFSMLSFFFLFIVMKMMTAMEMWNHRRKCSKKYVSFSAAGKNPFGNCWEVSEWVLLLFTGCVWLLKSHVAVILIVFELRNAWKGILICQC